MKGAEMSIHEDEVNISNYDKYFQIWPSGFRGDVGLALAARQTFSQKYEEFRLVSLSSC